MLDDLDTWVPFMMRVALIAGQLEGGTDEMPRIEEDFRRIVGEEGGRLLGLFWHDALVEVGEDGGHLQLVGIFETRSQYPVFYQGKPVSLEKYIRSPTVVEEDTPEPLEPECMAQAIQKVLEATGRYLVVEFERWHRIDEFRASMQSRNRDVEREPHYWALVVGEEQGDN